jgi:AbiV family abortive infection protein
VGEHGDLRGAAAPMTIEDSERKALLTMTLVIANAQRLLDDARLLFEHGRYPTSLSIAVLSMEESGKALLMCRAVKQTDLRHHVIKQTDATLQLSRRF